ncbi:hypothetical protein N7495_008478 [Penicillium taxi]|uniref:uncharacterized protein n=1 Tax=Penicillium taxi TaxID=168475 RepID=UPI002545737A|nr:uncharacterized protein N7495_008478 [Penicillium taxi]KAJ5888437.1 hypothetical protein N7495_008478 [Penicillium taxi]
MDYSNYAGHQSQPFSLYGLPTPDQQPHNDDAVLRDSFSLNNYNQQYFPGFDPRLDPSSFGAPPHSPPDSFTKHSDSHSAKQEPSSIDGDENHLMDLSVERSDSEEKDSMTPAQSKRKAQNRAAQRAFRERKERHVKDLEEKVASLEAASSKMQADNERLQRQLSKFSTENEILRATSHSMTGNNNNFTNGSTEPTVTGPMKYSPTDFYTTLNPSASPGEASASAHGDTQNLPHRNTMCQITGERLLDVRATWDLIQNHQMFKQGLVDVADVTERLKGMAQCNGQGPAFRESDILRAMAESSAVRDELI